MVFVMAAVGGCRSSDRLPMAVSNNAVASAGDRVYSFTGITDPADPETITARSFVRSGDGDWSRIADAPSFGARAKVAASAVTIRGEVYLIGGYTVEADRSEKTDPRLFRHDAETDAYVRLADVPTEVDDTVPVVYRDRYLYLVSGWHGPIHDNTTAVQVYDVETDTWSPATPLPAPSTGDWSGLFGHVGGISGNTILIADGVWRDEDASPRFQVSKRVFLGEIDPGGTGDVTAIAWREVEPHPGVATYRAAGASVEMPDGLIRFVGGSATAYNFEGIGYDGTPAEPLDQVVVFDPRAQAGRDRWRVEPFGPGLVPTMDHRGLVPMDGGWGTVGGMIGPGETTPIVQIHRFMQEPDTRGRTGR